MSPKADFIVSCSLDELPALTGPGQFLPCAYCGKDVYVTEDTLQDYGNPPIVPVLCWSCATKLLKEEKK